MGTSSVSSSVSNSSNTGASSKSTKKTGATGGIKNTTTIVSNPGANGKAGTSTNTVRTQGDPGFQLGQESEVIRNFRKYFGL